MKNFKKDLMLSSLQAAAALSSDSVSGRFGRIPGHWLFGLFRGFFNKKVLIKNCSQLNWLIFRPKNFENWLRFGHFRVF